LGYAGVVEEAEVSRATAAGESVVLAGRTGGLAGGEGAIDGDITWGDLGSASAVGWKEEETGVAGEAGDW